jgi:hypothetical protein
VRTYSFLLMALLMAAAPLACRKPAQPSEAYSQAHLRFSKLYGAKGDAAFLEPEMAEVEALLGQVPADSMDAAAAGELRARIQAGRQQAEAQARAQEEARTKAREQGQLPAGFGSAPSTPEPATGEELADAGTDDGTGGVPGIGTPAAQLASGFSGCFRKGEQLEVRGRGLRERWELADRAACRQQYGSLQDQVLIIEDGKVLALAPKSSIQALPTDGGTSPTNGGR